MEDQQIIRLYWDRNEQAIPATAEKYGNYCTVIAQNILGSRENAEECVNDTYLNAWNSMPPHRPGVLSAFLGKITRNLSLSRYRHNTAQKRGDGELPAVLEELAEVVSGRDDVEQEVDRRELVRAVEGFLNDLPAKQRDIFLCRYWYTEGTAEIAARYGMKDTAVSMTLSRIRSKLHSYLSERGFDL